MGLNYFNTDPASGMRYYTIYGKQDGDASATDPPLIAGVVPTNMAGKIHSIAAKCLGPVAADATVTITCTRLREGDDVADDEVALTDPAAITIGETDTENTWEEGVLVDAAKHVKAGDVLLFDIGLTGTPNNDGTMVRFEIEPFF